MKLNAFISEEERAAELSRIQLQLEEKLEQLDASFSAAKEHYVKCAKAMDCIQSQQYRQMGNPLQGLQEQALL